MEPETLRGGVQAHSEGPLGEGAVRLSPSLSLTPTFPTGPRCPFQRGVPHRHSMPELGSGVAHPPSALLCQPSAGVGSKTEGFSWPQQQRRSARVNSDNTLHLREDAGQSSPPPLPPGQGGSLGALVPPWALFSSSSSSSSEEEEGYFMGEPIPLPPQLRSHPRGTPPPPHAKGHQGRNKGCVVA